MASSHSWKFVTLLVLALLDVFTSANSATGNSPVAIIIGAGPVGLATALSLSSVCHKVYLVEERTSFVRQKATIGVALKEQKILKALDSALYDIVKQGALIDPVGNSWLCLWSEFRDALVDVARNRSWYRGGNIQFCMGRKCVDIMPVDGRVAVRFRNAGLPLVGDFVVETDEIHSRVRQRLDVPTSNGTSFQGSLYVSSTASPQLSALLQDDKIITMNVTLGNDIHFLVFNFHKRHPRRLAWIFTTNGLHNESMTVQQILRDHDIPDAEMCRLMEEIINNSDPTSWIPYPPQSNIMELTKYRSVSAKECGQHSLVGQRLIVLGGDTEGTMEDDNGSSIGLEDVVLLGQLLKEPGELSEQLRKFELVRMSRLKGIN